MSSNLLNNIERATTCAVCFELFDDPRVLPCQHSFCLQCIQQLPTKRSAGRRRSIHWIRRCPICRNKFHIPVLDNLPKDLTAKSFVDLYCSNPQKYCPNHKHKELDIYCLSCQIQICVKCVMSATGQHKSCNTVMLDEWIQDQKMEIAAEIKVTKDFLKNIKYDGEHWKEFAKKLDISKTSEAQVQSNLDSCISTLMQLKSSLCSLKSKHETLHTENQKLAKVICDSALEHIETTKLQLCISQSSLDAVIKLLESGKYSQGLKLKNENKLNQGMKSLPFDAVRDLFCGDTGLQLVTEIVKFMLEEAMHKISTALSEKQKCRYCLRWENNLTKVSCPCGYCLCSVCYDAISSASDACVICKHSIISTSAKSTLPLYTEHRSQQFQVFLKFGEKTYSIFTSNDEKVVDFKEKVSEKIHISGQVINIRTFAGRALCNSKQLGFYPIQKETTLLVSVQLQK